MKILIEFQDNFGNWRRYGESHNQSSSYRLLSQKSSSTGKRFRIIDTDGRILDIINP